MTRRRQPKRQGGGHAPARRLPEEATRLLFLNWVQVLCEHELGPQQSSTASDGSWTYGSPLDAHLRLVIAAPAYKLIVASQGIDPRRVKDIIDRAWALASEGNLGEGSWRQASFKGSHEIFSADGGLHFMRLLGDHGRRRVEGPAKLGPEILLEFTQRGDASSPVPLPDFEVNAVFKVPGPGPGPYTDRRVVEAVTVIRAVLAYATAASITQNVGGFWPPGDEELRRVAQLLGAAEVGELVVDGNVLSERMNEMAQLDPTGECLRRFQGGLFAYEQALLQSSGYVALVLLISAIEALGVPNTEWHRSRLVKRFTTFVLQACPDAVDRVQVHPNFESAFGQRRSPRRFLEDLYDQRSRPLHTGFMPHMAMSIGFHSDDSVRVALVSDLTRAALGSFLFAPFTPIATHPILYPTVS